MLRFDEAAAMASVGQVIKEARKQRGYVQRQIADAAKVSVQAVGQWERGDNDISMEKLRAVATFLGIDPVAANAGELRFMGVGEPLNEIEQVTDAGAMPNLGPRDVEVYGVTVGGDDADFSFNGEVVQLVKRPPGIAGLKNVFAVHVVGTSMFPKFEPGDLLYCGGRAPVPGDYVVVEEFPDEQHPKGKGYIKRLDKRAPGKLTCWQFNPEGPVEFDAYAIKAVHRVIPLRELLGY